MKPGERDVADVYFVTLLQHVGCTAFAHETAALFGVDDISVRASGARINFANPKEALPSMAFELGKGAAPLVRARAVISAFSKGHNCEVAVHMTRRLGLGTGVQRGLNEIYECWDGKGNPRKLSGEDIALPAPFAPVASQAVIFERIGGPDLANEMISRRAGAALDPSTADAAVAVIDAEPHCRIGLPRLDEVARAFADLIDLKSPDMHGHASLTIPRAKQVRRRRGLEATPARQRSMVANLSPKNA